MKIVVLDGYTLNPGDLSWGELQNLGECEIHDRTSAADVVARALNADIILTNKTPINRETLASLPKVKYFGVIATGYNIVDVEAARERKIPVTNVPAYGTASVAQMVFAHLLNLTQHIGHHADTVRAGTWSRSPDFCYWNFPLIELRHRVMGIVGYGRIGDETAKIARAFGMRVLGNEKGNPPALTYGVTFLPLDDVFQQSDVISLHCPLTPETRHIVNAARLKLMKPSAFLINTSRGPLIDEEALANALTTGAIAGAGLDVLSREPPEPENPLLKAPNCYITPHIAWATKAARKRLLDAVVENLKRFLEGHPQNVVNQA